jgi:Spy/CpxP family protein refolding chaperone
MRNHIIVTVALFAALGLSVGVSAQPPEDGHGWHHHHGGPFAHELKELGLTDAQKGSIKQIVQAAHQQLKPQMQALRQQHEALETATPGTAAYQAATTSLAQAAATAANARVQEEASVRAQIYAVLTDAQKTQLAGLIQQHEAKMAQWQAAHPAPTE